jgi:hypothetical protein
MKALLRLTKAYFRPFYCFSHLTRELLEKYIYDKKIG